MRRGFTLVEVIVVVAVVGVSVAAGIAMVSAQLAKKRDREIALRHVEELRAIRLDFVNNGAAGLRLVPVAGGAELRSVTGSCADEAGGLPTSTLDRLQNVALPISFEWCADRYGRATSATMVPTDVTVVFSDTPVPAYWDRNGRIFLDTPAEDPPIRPVLENMSSLTTRTPTPASQPTDPQWMLPGVLR
jgi:prepilin-type N-terminal cleavage/methylation domain-containing protein